MFENTVGSKESLKFFYNYGKEIHKEIQYELRELIPFISDLLESLVADAELANIDCNGDDSIYEIFYQVSGKSVDDLKILSDGLIHVISETLDKPFSKYLKITDNTSVEDLARSIIEVYHDYFEE